MRRFNSQSNLVLSSRHPNNNESGTFAITIPVEQNKTNAALLEKLDPGPWSTILSFLEPDDLIKMMFFKLPMLLDEVLVNHMMEDPMAVYDALKNKCVFLRGNNPGLSSIFPCAKKIVGATILNDFNAEDLRWLFKKSNWEISYPPRIRVGRMELLRFGILFFSVSLLLCSIFLINIGNYLVVQTIDGIMTRCRKNDYQPQFTQTLPTCHDIHTSQSFCFFPSGDSSKAYSFEGGTFTEALRWAKLDSFMPKLIQACSKTCHLFSPARRWIANDDELTLIYLACGAVTLSFGGDYKEFSSMWFGISMLGFLFMVLAITFTYLQWVMSNCCVNQRGISPTSINAMHITWNQFVSILSRKLSFFNKNVRPSPENRQVGLEEKDPLQLLSEPLISTS